VADVETPKSFEQEYEGFRSSGAPDPSWYPAYTEMARYLGEVRARLLSDSEDTPLSPRHVPALNEWEWDIPEGSVEAFLETIWKLRSNGVADVGLGFIYPAHWESMLAFSKDGVDLRAITAAVIRQPSAETQRRELTDWFKAWAVDYEASRVDGVGPKARIPWAMIFRLIAGLDPEHYTSIADQGRMFRFAKFLGLTAKQTHNDWYTANELALAKLDLPDDDPIMRNCFLWYLSERVGQAPPGVDPPERVSFTAEDCEFLGQFIGGVELKELTADQKARLTNLRRGVKELAVAARAQLSGDVDLNADASQWNVHNRVGPDLWCCVFPAAVGNKAYALQIAFIISPSGSEICFCLGSGTGKGAERAIWREQFTDAKERLALIPQSMVEEVETSMDPSWAFRSSWRKPSGEGEFSTLRDWLTFAASPNGSGASISKYLTPGELEDRGTAIVDDLVELGSAFIPIIDTVYGDVDDLEPEADEEDDSPGDLRYTREWLADLTLWPEDMLDAVIASLEGRRRRSSLPARREPGRRGWRSISSPT
jgi:hypothetical protein